MRRLIYLIVATFLFAAGTTVAGDYNYITAEKMKDRLKAGEDVLIVDIQVEKEFLQHHLPGSVATYAYPVKTEEEQARIDKAITSYKENGTDIVIVCPRGKGGAKRCYDYLVENKIPADKIAILENGIGGWPYKEMLNGSDTK